tara:strand:+ start:2206 stop:2745 length:540 start_codon:yes stop_codon:yes gene_type:complete
MNFKKKYSYLLILIPILLSSGCSYRKRAIAADKKAGHLCNKMYLAIKNNNFEKASSLQFRFRQQRIKSYRENGGVSNLYIKDLLRYPDSFFIKYENIWRCYNWSSTETFRLARKFNTWKCAYYSYDWYCENPTTDNLRVQFKHTEQFRRKQDRFNGYKCRKWDSATFTTCRKKFLFWWI